MSLVGDDVANRIGPALALAALAGGLALAGVADIPGPGAAIGDEIARSERQLAVERSAREGLEAQLARVEADLAGLRDRRARRAPAAAPDAAPEVADEAEPTADSIAEAAAEEPSPGHGWFDAGRLSNAGLSEREVSDLKRLFEETELERLYLHDQASASVGPTAVSRRSSRASTRSSRRCARTTARAPTTGSSTRQAVRTA